MYSRSFENRSPSPNIVYEKKLQDVEKQLQDILQKYKKQQSQIQFLMNKTKNMPEMYQ
jgi:hypothetical protein